MAGFMAIGNTELALFTAPFPKLGETVSLAACDAGLKRSLAHKDIALKQIQIVSDMPQDELCQLFGLFHLVRNGKNGVPVFDRSDIVEPKWLPVSNDAYVLTLATSGALDAYSTTQILSTTKEKLNELQSFYFVGPNTPEEDAELGKCRAQIDGLEWEARIARGVPEGVDTAALKNARTMSQNAVGDLSDLSVELRNVIANFFYDMARMARRGGITGLAGGSNPTIYTHHVTQVVTVINSLPEYVKMLRDCRSARGESKYRALTNNVLYDLRYGTGGSGLTLLKKAWLKLTATPIVSEIPGLFRYF